MIRMTRILALSVAVALAAGNATRAQTPAAPPTVDPQVQQANFTPHPFGMQRCETCEGYTCVAETTAHKKTVYTSKCVPFCIPYCNRGCDEGCTDCGVIVHRKVLIKKSIDCGTDTKCVAKPCAPPVK